MTNHCGQRSGLTTAGGAGDDDEAFVEVAELLERLGEIEFFEGENLSGNLAEDGRLSPVIVEVVAPETREAFHLISEVEILVSEKIFPTLRRTDFLEERFHLRGIDRCIFEGHECAGIAYFWRQPDGEVKIGTAFFDHLAEE